MPANLTDVAKRAGVSLATASRAFSAPDRLATETRKKVLLAAAALQYEIPTTAGSRIYAVVVPDVGNVVFAALIAAIQEQAWQGRHRMILANTAEESSRESEILRTIGRSVDGVILCSPRSASNEIQDAIGDTPLVVINGDVAFATSVLMDVEVGIRQAVEHLFALGHRKIVYVPGPAASWANQRREHAISIATAEHELELVIIGNQAASVEGGLAAAAAVVSSGATAVLAYNDLIALGVQAGARSLGRNCPRDLSIIGIDDLDIAAVADPGLTSIRVAIERSGSMSLGILLDLIAGKSSTPQAIHLNSQLIVRNSSAAAPSSN